MSEKAWIRKLAGKPAVFHRYITSDKVEVSLDGKEMALSLYEWKKLPVWDGPSPAS